jgi:hypothetical protein
MKIVIESIPHKNQRYPTVGDYWRDEEGVLHITVSSMSDDRYEYLVALHELVEVLICEHKGIKEEDITAFDIKFEEDRLLGLHGPDDEPGHNKFAPYNLEHVFAEKLERLMSEKLEVDWTKYDKEVNSL